MSGIHRPPATAPGQKLNFNAIPTPPNYVPGLGRGAMGFTTRSDIGPARLAPETLIRKEQQEDKDKAKDEKDDVDESKFDEFMGNDAGAFAVGYGEYDQDDREADKVWDDIDDHMDQRRRKTREKRLKEELEEMRKKNPKITETFADLKRELAETMTMDDWEAIPEIGDHTIKKPKRETFTPLPDSIITGAAAAGKTGSSIANGSETPSGTLTSLTEIGKGRQTMVDIQLERASDSVSGQTVVDPKGYLTDLGHMRISSDAEIGDIKRARTLLKSVINTNPKHSPGWVAAARLEEVANKPADARRLIQKGCELCPGAEDVWLEYARLSKPEDARAVVARGVHANPTSVKLWQKAADLETERVGKSRVFRRALETNNTSVALWKSAVDLAESDDDARILLARAVECCPQHTDLWLALARLSDYTTARSILNKARVAIPTEPLIWISAAKLEEAHDNAARVSMIIVNGIKSLQKNSVIIDRDYWLKQAEEAEKSTPPSVETCKAIVEAVIERDVEEMDRKRTWKADAEQAARNEAIQTARAIYSHALKVFPGKKSIWKAAALLEKAHGTRQSLDELLKQAVRYCPQAEQLWLMAAKEKWLAGDLNAARVILHEAFAANDDKESLWLAAWKLEFENKEPKRAQGLLQRARERASSSTARVWMKSAITERDMQDPAAERRILEEGIKKFPTLDKLYLMRGQLEERQGHLAAAHAAYQSGLRRCIHSVPLWTSLARLEERQNVQKARAILEQGRVKNPKNDLLWLAAIRTELRSEQKQRAENLLAKALQECPNSGRLLAEQINLVPRPQRKLKSAEALKKANDDPILMAAIARIFWLERRVEKAREWTNRAILLDPDIGDIWAMYYSFELQHDPEKAKDILARCSQQEPRHGERWQAVAKDPQNAHKKADEILLEVVKHMEEVALP